MISLSAVIQEQYSIGYRLACDVYQKCIMLMLFERLPVILVSFRKPEYNIGKKEGESLMSLHAFEPQGAPSSDEMEVRRLY